MAKKESKSKQEPEPARDVSPEPEAPAEEAKPKRKVTPEQLQRLAEARAKAHEKRRLLGEISRREKAEKQAAFEAKAAALAKAKAAEEGGARIAAPSKKGAPERIVCTAKRAPKPKQEPEPESEEESESESEESESEIEEPPPPPKKTKAKKKPTPKAQSSAQLTHRVAKESLAQRIERDRVAAAYASLFPGMNFVH
jgi:hypothetical protein